MSRRMDYTVEFDAPAEKMYQDFTSREYWQTLMDAYRFLTPHSEITTFSSGDRAHRDAGRLDHHSHIAFRSIRPRQESGQGYLRGLNSPRPRQFRRPVLSHRDRRRQQVATRQCLQG